MNTNLKLLLADSLFFPFLVLRLGILHFHFVNRFLSAAKQGNKARWWHPSVCLSVNTLMAESSKIPIAMPLVIANPRPVFVFVFVIAGHVRIISQMWSISF